MYRRSTTTGGGQSNPIRGENYSGSTVSRASTVSGSAGGGATQIGSIGSNNPFASSQGRRDFPELAGLSLEDGPPPPTYQTAVNQAFRTTHESTSSSAASPSGGATAQHLAAGARTSIPAPPPTQQQFHQQGPLPPSVHTQVAPSISNLDRRSSRGSDFVGRPPPPSPSATSTTQRSNTNAPVRRSSIEDPLAPLGKYDLCILLDDSPSMTDYWGEARDALIGVAQRFVKYDKDGIDLCFMNNDSSNLNNVTDASTVREAFENVQPFGSTPTAMVLDEIIRDVVDRIEDSKAGKGPKVKPLIVLVLTDGRADDSDGLRDLLIEMAGRLDAVKAPPFQLGITFLQIGSDPDATDFLRELDDDLKAESGVRDIVDTLPFQGQITPEFILKAALGSVNKRLDG